MIVEQMGSDLKVEVIPRDPQFKEIQRQYIDATILNIATGWSPSVRLEEGLRKTIEWYRARVK